VYVFYHCNCQTMLPFGHRSQSFALQSINSGPVFHMIHFLDISLMDDNCHLETEATFVHE
jgi:hypothetical protein